MQNPSNTPVRTQTTLRFVCVAQLKRYRAEQSSVHLAG
jgi:hypothetical protein